MHLSHVFHVISLQFHHISSWWWILLILSLSVDECYFEVRGLMLLIPARWKSQSLEEAAHHCVESLLLLRASHPQRSCFSSHHTGRRHPDMTPARPLCKLHHYISAAGSNTNSHLVYLWISPRFLDLVGCLFFEATTNELHHHGDS